MRVYFVLLAAFISSTANAQIFQCIKDGKTTFQDSPCDPLSSVSRAVGGSVNASSKLPWEGLSYGMSIDEVQRKVPGANREVGSHLYNGAKSLLNKKGVAIGGVAFSADYFFIEEAFTQVNFTDNAMKKNEERMKAFEKLSSEFRSKYGKEGSRNLKNEKWGLSGGAEWLVAGGKIWISISPITADTSTLTVGYNPSNK